MVFICTHKDFQVPDFIKDTGENYTIISNTPLQNKYEYPVIYADNILKNLKQSYCEGYMIYDIYLRVLKNEIKDDFIGICHYRRYLKNLKVNKFAIAWPIGVNLNTHYYFCHVIDNLIQCENIIDTHFPEYKANYYDLKTIHDFYIGNLLYLPRQKFIRYCNFVFGVLNIFNEQNGITCDDDITRYLEVKLKSMKPIPPFKRTDLDYQKRMHGFLMERLGTIFFWKEFDHLGNDKVLLYKDIIELK